MPILGIDHVQIAMPAGEEAGARAFYRDVLGLSEVPKPPSLAQRGGCWFERGPVKVHLGVDKDYRPAAKAHPGFLVEGLDAIAQTCRAAGCSVEFDDLLEGYDRFYVHDPFGNRLEFLERKQA